MKLEKLIFFRLLVYFNPGLQNDFTLQCLDLCKIDEAKAGISRAKEALYTNLKDLKFLNYSSRLYEIALLP